MVETPKAPLAVTSNESHMNNSIIVAKQNNVLVVDSRMVAEELGIKHKTFLETIRKHQATIECHFGKVPFQTAPLESGQSEIFAWLNEDQSTFLMTLSRNTPKVIDCKVKLVKAFSEAKKKLREFAKHAHLLNVIDLTGNMSDIEKTCLGEYICDRQDHYQTDLPRYSNIPEAIKSLPNKELAKLLTICMLIDNALSPAALAPPLTKLMSGFSASLAASSKPKGFKKPKNK